MLKFNREGFWGFGVLVVGAFSTEGFHVFNALTGERIFKQSYSERCFNVDLNFGDTELCVLLMGFKGVHQVNTYDFREIVTSKKISEPKYQITFRDENPTQASWGLMNEYFYVSSYKPTIS